MVRGRTGEKVNVTYQASQDSLDDDGDVCTVPDRHLDLLVLFCKWAAFRARRGNRPPVPVPEAIQSH